MTNTGTLSSVIATGAGFHTVVVILLHPLRQRRWRRLGPTPSLVEFSVIATLWALSEPLSRTVARKLSSLSNTWLLRCVQRAAEFSGGRTRTDALLVTRDVMRTQGTGVDDDVNKIVDPLACQRSRVHKGERRRRRVNRFLANKSKRMRDKQTSRWPWKATRQCNGAEGGRKEVVWAVPQPGRQCTFIGMFM